jgi:protein-disulfide isomerase
LLTALAFAQTGKRTELPDAPSASSTPSAPSPQAADLPTKETVDSFMKHMFGYDSSIQWQVLSIRPSPAPHMAEVLVGVKNPEGQQVMRLFVTADRNWAIAGDMMRFGADPFAFNNKEFDARAHGPSRGPKDSPITVIEFSDLQCPACKAAQPTIDRLVTEVPNVHFIFQHYPLESLHPWAFKAAEYGDCVARDNPDAFWKFIALDYQNQESVTAENADAKLKDFVAQAGANPDRVTACVAQPATATRIRESLALGEAVQVTGTPTLFVNGRAVQNVSGVPFEVLKLLAQGTEK